jgi:hypothetical protein
MNNYFLQANMYSIKNGYMQSTPTIQLLQAAEAAGLGTYPTHELEPNLFLLPLGYGQQQS